MSVELTCRRCMAAGRQMVVEDMNILTTVFLGDYNAKIWYPNSILASKPIQNFYRSPDMGDNFDFVVDSSTSAEKIAQMKARVGKYIEAHPHHWNSMFSLLVVDLVEVNKMKLSLGLYIPSTTRITAPRRLGGLNSCGNWRACLQSWASSTTSSLNMSTCAVRRSTFPPLKPPPTDWWFKVVHQILA